MNIRICSALIMAVSLFAASANGAPMAFSINSDSGDLLTADSLYRIDLATGTGQRMGELFTGIETRRDTEGLAVDPLGVLWGIDDDSRTLFQINKENGTIKFGEEIPFSGFPAGGGNDFGMTFSCDNSLYVTSVVTGTLYELDLDAGSKEAIGAMGVNISAIAAIGNPTKLYGLGNGLLGNGEMDSPNLYSIDLDTGLATSIGPLGAEAGDYHQGGLTFDSDGTLWAITDRSGIDSKTSQILRIDVNTGTATLVSSTSEIGFESLAIGPPTACNNDQVNVDQYPRIPTLSPAGRLLAIFALLLAGMIILRRRTA